MFTVRLTVMEQGLATSCAKVILPSIDVKWTTCFAKSITVFRSAISLQYIN